MQQQPDLFFIIVIIFSNKRKNIETGGTFHLCDVNIDHRAHCQLTAKLDLRHQQLL